MGFQHTTGGDTSDGGKFLKEEGIYHFVIRAIDEQPTKKDGSLIDNAAFRADLQVLDGTGSDQKDKVTDILFFYPKASDKNDGAFAKKKFDRFFLAANLASKEDLSEKGKKLDIELKDAVGKQVVAKFANDDDGRLGLSFTDIWHVDDPGCKAVPKLATALAMIPAKDRWIGQKPKPEEKKQEPPKKTAPAATDYSDL